MTRDGQPRYHDYIVSEAWYAFKRRFMSSGWPTSCVICEAPHVTLHHTTYERLGCEEFRDIVPMCWPCHEMLHDKHEHAGRGGPEGFVKQAVKVFGIAKHVLKSKMAKWIGKPPEKRKKPKSHKKHKRKKRGEHWGTERVQCPECNHPVQRRALCDHGVCRPCFDKKRADETIRIQAARNSNEKRRARKFGDELRKQRRDGKQKIKTEKKVATARGKFLRIVRDGVPMLIPAK